MINLMASFPCNDAITLYCGRSFEERNFSVYCYHAIVDRRIALGIKSSDFNPPFTTKRPKVRCRKHLLTSSVQRIVPIQGRHRRIQVIVFGLYLVFRSIICCLAS